MQRIHFLLTLLLLTPAALAAQSAPDSAADSTAIDSLDGRLDAVERELAKSSAIRISGYVQTEWQHFDQTTSVGGRALYSDGRKNLFTVRRGRIKLQHRFGSVMSYTVQPDITESGVTIKDAFVTLNLAGNDLLRLDAGMFNRPNFEVELSSSARESPERSQIVRAFYPGERDLGVMLTTRPTVAVGIAPRLQVGLFNGPGTRAEVDAIKDIIARLTLPLSLSRDSLVTASIGGSFFYGGIPQTGDSIARIIGPGRFTTPNEESGGMAGFGNNTHVGVEAQLELALLPFGRTTLRGELLTGERATAGAAATPASVGVGRTSDGRDTLRVVPGAPATHLTIRRQMGYYFYVVQAIGDDVQLVAKYDLFDRNTDVAGVDVQAASESASGVIGFGANYFWRNLRVTLFYEIPRFAEGESIQIDPATRRPVEALRDVDARDNRTTLRLQYRF